LTLLFIKRTAYLHTYKTIILLDFMNSKRLLHA